MAWRKRSWGQKLYLCTYTYRVRKRWIDKSWAAVGQLSQWRRECLQEVAPDYSGIAE